MEVDLHSHSIYSDGTKSPEELLEMARSIGLKYYALTDHDYIEGSKILISLPHDDITLYSGVEMSAKVSKGQMHILGYNFDLENKALNDSLKELRNFSIDNMKRYIEILKRDFNIEFPEEDINELFSRKGKIGRPHLGELLIRYGYAKDMDEVFDKYLNYAHECIRSTKKTLTKEEIIELINNAGGIAVLAHPWTLKMTDTELHEEIAYLKSLGLKGIETIHSENDEKRVELYKKLAKEFDLIETGGTDYHGPTVKEGLELGSGINNNVNINSNDITITKLVPSRYQ